MGKYCLIHNEFEIEFGIFLMFYIKNKEILYLHYFKLDKITLTERWDILFDSLISKPSLCIFCYNVYCILLTFSCFLEKGKAKYVYLFIYILLIKMKVSASVRIYVNYKRIGNGKEEVHSCALNSLSSLNSLSLSLSFFSLLCLTFMCWNFYGHKVFWNI